MSEQLEITQGLFDNVQRILGEFQPLSQGAFGFFSTQTRHAVSYQNLEIRERVQNELDHAVALLGIAHVMSIFEENFPNTYWDEIITDQDSLNKLKAYKHIRNITVNGFTGKRTMDDNEYDFFNEVMNSEKPLQGVKSFSDEKVLLTESAGIFAHTFISDITNTIVVEVHRRLQHV